MIYHVGYLPLDREPTLSKDSLSAGNAMLVDRLATQAYEDWLNGKAILMQKRLAPFAYEYHSFPIKARREPRRNARGAQQAPARSAAPPSAG